MSNKVLVIGAQNIDIFTKTKSPYILRDSNICKVSIGFGGVGRNIVENLVRLGNDVSFITVFSNDHFGKIAKQSLQDLKVNLKHSLDVSNISNSVYLGILDEENDMYLGLNDMEIIEQLSVAYLSSVIDFINTFEFAVIDNNLSEDSIVYLLKHITGKKIMDAVSAHKVHKIAKYLELIDYLKVNKIEDYEMTKIRESLDVVNFPNTLHLIKTNGEKDIEYFTDSRHRTTPRTCDHIVNASGAGDGFLSGFVHGLLIGATDKQKLAYAKNVAYYTLLSEDATYKDLNKEEVEDETIY